ncbi:MAG: aldo/keto reductase [Clostridia bacterium]
MSISSNIKLNNGVEIPILGLGVYLSGKDTYTAVRTALDEGYRHIDTAMVYENESDVGRAVKDSGIAREDIFITTKLWNDDMRANNVRGAAEKSLALLGLDYIDLYLIHWPVAGKFMPSYKVMEDLYRKGMFRAIGVSNFLSHHMDALLKETEVVPAVNQIEIHPYLTNQTEIDYCKAKGIAPEAWAPLARGKAVKDKTIKAIAKKYNKTPAQIVIRWHIQRGVIVIPKSVTSKRIAENAKVFDFLLSAEDISAINALNMGLRTGPDPDTFDF